ncbi:MAG: peptidylprolyl isomerase [Candidatus Binatia bacterium]
MLAASAAPAASQPPPAAEAKPSTAVLSGTAKFDNGVVAVVDGEPITLRELKRYGITGAPFLPPEIRNDYRALLDSMIENRLLKAEFVKNGVTAPDEMVERYITGVLKESGQTRASLEADVVNVGLTWKDYFERMRDEVNRIQLINLLIRSRVNVSEEEVRRAWESGSEFVESEKLVVGAIFIPAPLIGEGAEAAKEQALAVHKEARSNFEAAAREHSKGPAASEGGVLGEFERGSMAPHFEEALQGLKKGGVSEPVQASGGYYIVKLVDIKRSGRQPFEDVKEELSEKMYEQRLNERYQKWVTEDLRKDHRIDNLVDSLAEIAASSTAPRPAAPASVAPATAPESTPPANAASDPARPATPANVVPAVPEPAPAASAAPADAPDAAKPVPGAIIKK